MEYIVYINNPNDLTLSPPSSRRPACIKPCSINQGAVDKKSTIPKKVVA
jgi:hypothetical protein